MAISKCKICRRFGEKLFLKGEKCLSPKCPMLKKPYPPGMKKRGPRALSEFGKELREKQKLKNWYNLGERQFKKYVKEVLEKRGKVEDAAYLLIKKLESRFDNVVFRFGFAPSRTKARQLVSHGHFLVNGKPVNIPSLQLKKGDKVSIRPTSLKKAIFQHLSTILKKHQLLSWFELDYQKLEGKIIGEPKLEEIVPPVKISAIFEYYSK